MLVDYFSYKAIRNKSSIIIEPPCLRFEQAMKLGYITHEMQSISDSCPSHSEYETVSLIERSRDFTRHFGDKLFCIKDIPARRIALEIPVPAIESFKKMIMQDILFKEEIVELNLHIKNLLLTKEQIEETQIYNNLTIMDIIKFERVIRFVNYAYIKFIEDKQLQNSGIFLRSLVTVSISNNEGLVGILSFLFGVEKTRYLIDLLSWEQSSETVFDIQKSPLIRWNKAVLFPMFLTARTNLVQNILQKIRFRFDSNSDIDPVGDMLERFLRLRTSNVYRDLTYQWGNKEGDVDVIALMEKTMFVFECKNSLHPCNVFELRTSYDYIKKAGEQLSKFNELFQKQQFKNYLSDKIGCENLDDFKIITCIAMGNRMFSGWQEQGHNVRPIHELCNIISSGIITTSVIKAGRKVDTRKGFRIWKEHNFNAEDLENYITTDLLYTPRFKSMIPIEEGVQIRGKKIIKKSFALNTKKLHDEFKKSFPYEKSTD